MEMYKFVTLVYIALTVQLVYSAVSRQPPVEKPEEFACEEGCYSPQLEMVIPYNESYAPPAEEGGCVQYNCQSDGWITIFSCGVIGVGPGFVRVEGDQSQSYPNCCPTAKPDGNAGPVSAVA